MTTAETARLLVQMDLGGNLSRGIKGIEQQLSGLNRNTGKISSGFKNLGAGFLVAGIRATALLVAQSGAVVGAVAAMAREGQEAANVQIIYAKAIANSGKISTQYVDILNAQQTALMNLGGVDDELIKTEQTRLIQMGLTGDQVAKLTPLILDFSKATGVDLLTATKLAGKAVDGNAGALARYGIQIDKAKFKTDPFAATMDALNKRFGGTTKALSGSLDTRLKALNENFANIREEAGIRLLPALTRIVDVAGKDLVPAFGKFIDRVLPSLISGIDQFASLLENGGAERGIKAITDALGPMVDMLKIAAAPVKAIVSAFLSLPSQVQGVLVGAFAVNKLSGGLIAKGVGEIAGSALGGGGLLGRGSSPANPLFVSDVMGGAGKAGALAAGGIWSKVGTLIGGAFAIVAVAALADEIHSVISPGGGLEGRTTGNMLLPADQLSWPFGPKNTPKWDLGPFKNVLGGDSSFTAAAGVGGVNDRGSSQGPVPVRVVGTRGASMEQARGNQAGVLARAVAAGFHPNAAAIQRTMDKNAIHAESVAQRVAAATRDTANGVLALPGALKNALGGLLYTGGGRPGKDDTVVPGKPRLTLVQQSQNKRGYASGAWDVLGDQTADIHEGEMIVPRRMAEKFRRTAALKRLRNTSHPLPGLSASWRNAEGLIQGITGDVGQPFVPSVRLDASQIRDRRNHLRGKWVDDMAIAGNNSNFVGRPVVAVVSTRDVKSAQIVKRRFGPTAAEAGAM